MRRRAYLTAGLAVAAGCLGQRRPPPARLDWIWLRNDWRTAHRAHVEVTDGGARVFERTVTLGTTQTTANVVFDRPVEGPGRYVVLATLAGETVEITTTKYISNRERCLGVRFTILDTGQVDYWTKSMEQC